jgi:hypothetical protein
MWKKHLSIFFKNSFNQRTIVGEWMGRLVVEQDIGDRAPNILNLIIGKISKFFDP